MSSIKRTDMADGIMFDDHGQHLPAAVQTLYNNIVHSLDKHYPKFKGTWHIVIDTRGGLVQISNNLLSGKMGFVLHITQIDPEGKMVMRSAGELLERYRVTREKAIDLRDAIQNLERDNIGVIAHDG